MEESSRPNLSERFESLSKVAEKKVEVMDSQRAERIAQRKEAIKKIGESISEKWQSFRKWDKEAGKKLRVGATIAAGVPGVLGEATRDSAIAGAEAIKEAVKKGAEASKQYVIDRKDDLVEKAREVSRWVEDRGNDVEIFVENTKDDVVESVNSGIESVHNKYEQARENVSKNFLEAKGYAFDKANEYKSKLVSGWKRVQAVPLDIINNVAEAGAVKKWEKIQKDQAKLEQMNTMIGSRERVSADLKKTSKELVANFV